ncbi:MAG TPA: NAD(P)/FAD-dependent oxidoreductase [Flavobacteriaceae bacterium]|nr:NAD(P)/FAD-dependent oxidoreductase [Flavobacteriaceae bacterium]
MKKFQVAIIGGGLAGLTSSIHLARCGLKVILFEKNPYPIHKVCGEYLSKEVLPYLNSLGIDLKKETNPQFLNKLHFSSVSGKVLKTDLPLGGLGISRFCLDDLLYRKATENGAMVKIASVEKCDFETGSFFIKTTDEENFQAEIVLGTFGKRSNLDKLLNRKFIQEKSSWLAVKTHFENPDFPDDVVGLHMFDGGYCGISRTETNAVNFCYLSSYESFQKHKNIQEFSKNVLSKNKCLEEFLSNSKPLFEKPLSIAQISFARKKVVENHILLGGDAAGLIHPLCGNGMAMAIRGAKIVSELISGYFESNQKKRTSLENKYQIQWNKVFKKRLWVGNQLQFIMLKPKLSDFLISSVLRNETLLQNMIRKTHGNPF